MCWRFMKKGEGRIIHQYLYRCFWLCLQFTFNLKKIGLFETQTFRALIFAELRILAEKVKICSAENLKFVFFKEKIIINKTCFTKIFLFFLADINLFYINGHLIVFEEKTFLRKYNNKNH